MRLKDCISRAVVIAYKERTEALERCLSRDGFDVCVLRQEDSDELRGKSAIYRCLLNHRRAWELVATSASPALVVEADFVPVIGFGDRPAPFPGDAQFGMAWLYTCGPIIYRVTADGHIVGQSGSTVAYVLTPIGACYLLQFAETVRDVSEDGALYVPWDTQTYAFMKSKAAICYLGLRNYGEHGGLPSREHGHHGITHGGRHRADVLWGALSFSPEYAGTGLLRWPRFLWVRLGARARGLGRLLLGRLLSVKTLREARHPLAVLRVALRRHWYPPRGWLPPRLL